MEDCHFEKKRIGTQRVESSGALHIRCWYWIVLSWRICDARGHSETCPSLSWVRSRAEKHLQCVSVVLFCFFRSHVCVQMDPEMLCVHDQTRLIGVFFGGEGPLVRLTVLFLFFESDKLSKNGASVHICAVSWGSVTTHHLSDDARAAEAAKTSFFFFFFLLLVRFFSSINHNPALNGRYLSRRVCFL